MQLAKPDPIAPARHLVMILVAAILLCPNYTVGADPTTERQNYFEKKLKEQLSSDTPKGTLSELTNFSWTKVCLVLPYGTGIEKLSDIKIDVYTDLPWTLTETFWGLVFVTADGKYTGIRIHRMGLVDYDERSIDGACYLRSDARFAIGRKGKRRTLGVFSAKT